MATAHGRFTFVSLNGVDLSQYVTESSLERTSDTHDITTYGNNSKKFQGGLLDATASMSGIYDNTAVTGPRAAIRPLIGTTVTYIRRPEGTGSGRPQDSVSVVVESYTESSPVADMVTWEVSLQCTGDITSTSQ